MDHIPTYSLPPDHSRMGRGFYPSSTGDSPPAPSSDAHGPSITFAPSVSVCKGSSFESRQPTQTPPAHPVTVLPPAQPVIPVIAPPPAEPPPPTLLPLLDLSLSCSPLHQKGLLMHMLVHDGPVSPPSHFDQFQDSWDTTASVLLTDSPRGPRPFGSVHRVTSNPRVLGFHGGARSYARINLTALAKSATTGSLIDGGANICITGDLNSLFDVVAIPPLSISVAVEGDSSIDDCCTARGMTLLQLDDGSIYWQVCYFCKNAVETIISPQAIVDSSDVFQSWHQTGYRNDVSTPGCIRFDSHDGLLTMSMSLVLHDGLHYCPTNVFAVDTLPALRYSPAVRRVVGSESLPGLPPVPRKTRSHERFLPVSKAKQA